MKTYSVGPSLIAVAMLASVSACSTIKNLFPDKEKDYQYTVEIPPLNVPADLGKNDILDSHVAASSSPVAEEPTQAAAPETPAVNEPPAVEEPPKAAASDEVPIANEPPVVEEPAKAAVSEAPVANEPPVVVEPSQAAVSETPVANKPPAVEEPAKDTTPNNSTAADATASDSTVKSEIKLELAKSDTGASELRIGAPLARAWRIVGKALSRKSIEVTERNQEEGRFTVQYDPEEQKVEDGSLWDEAVFMFSGFQGNEKAYVLKLAENNQQTHIVLLDEAGQPLINDAAGLKLLTVLQDTIKADLADN